jgi:hypothetical protein
MPVQVNNLPIAALRWHNVNRSARDHALILLQTAVPRPSEGGAAYEG